MQPDPPMIELPPLPEAAPTMKNWPAGAPWFELPPLPLPHSGGSAIDYFTTAQMHAYARAYATACVLAERERVLVLAARLAQTFETDDDEWNFEMYLRKHIC